MRLGLGLRGLPLYGERLAYLLLGPLAAHPWWEYFGPNHDRVEAQFVGTSPARRNRMALLGFGYLHLVTMAGIILFAVALEVGVHEPGHHAPFPVAFNLAVGLAVLYAGHTLFRHVLGAGVGWLQVVISAVCAAGMLLGLHGSALLHLAVTAAVIVVVTLIEDYAGPDRGANRFGDAATS